MNKGFIIICRNCNKDIVLEEGINTHKKDIELQGACEALFDPEIYIYCNHCGNAIEIHNKI